MSDPKTAEEFRQRDITLAAADPGDSLVSTACPNCGVRFAMLARYYLKTKPAALAGTQLKLVTQGGFWGLRCINCGHICKGEPK